MAEHEHRSEEEVLAEQEADAIEDLDVPAEQRGDIAGGQTGGSSGSDLPTENISLN